MGTVLIAFDPSEPRQAREVAALARHGRSGWSLVLAAGGDLVGSLDDADQAPDIVLGYAPGPIEHIQTSAAEQGWQAPIVARWLPSWPDDLDRFHRLYDAVDGVLFADPTYCGRLGELPRTRAVGPGVDLAPLPLPTEDRLLWVGAEDPTQWSAFEVLQRQIERVSEAIGMPIDVLSAERATEIAKDHTRLSAWLESGSIVVCAHYRSDLPAILLDAAGADRTIVCAADADPHGLISDGVNGRLFDRSVVTDDTRESVIAAVRAASANRATWSVRLREDLAGWSWETRAEEMLSALGVWIDETARSATPARPASVDLRNEVTVFVTTVDAPSFAACQTHLDQQDCLFRSEVIRNVAPMSRAFQQMLDRCETPYYIQVDEDMLLYPWAVRKLHEAIIREPETIALAVAYLDDTHLGKLVQGVKIFRHAVVRRYPFVNEGSFEIGQINRLRADGFDYRTLLPERPCVTEEAIGPLGLHGTHWTKRSVYERYLTLGRERVRHPGMQKWLEAATVEFIERFLETRDPLDLYAFMGALSGTLLGAAEDRSKDFRDYEELPGFGRLQELMTELDMGSRDHEAPKTGSA